eukprot:Rhum_TRINITY_DN7899_c0_g1::Rhum_TRINITY_DN7899_c0_g1_i1::g.24908::m.24908
MVRHALLVSRQGAQAGVVRHGSGRVQGRGEGGWRDGEGANTGEWGVVWWCATVASDGDRFVAHGSCVPFFSWYFLLLKCRGERQGRSGAKGSWWLFFFSVRVIFFSFQRALYLVPLALALSALATLLAALLASLSALAALLAATLLLQGLDLLRHLLAELGLLLALEDDAGLRGHVVELEGGLLVLVSNLLHALGAVEHEDGLTVLHDAVPALLRLSDGLLHREVRDVAHTRELQRRVLGEHDALNLGGRHVLAVLLTGPLVLARLGRRLRHVLLLHHELQLHAVVLQLRRLRLLQVLLLRELDVRRRLRLALRLAGAGREETLLDAVHLADLREELRDLLVRRLLGETLRVQGAGKRVPLLRERSGPADVLLLLVQLQSLQAGHGVLEDGDVGRERLHLVEGEEDGELDPALLVGAHPLEEELVRHDVGVREVVSNLLRQLRLGVGHCEREVCVCVCGVGNKCQ